MKLSDKLAEIRARQSEQHGHEMAQVLDLAEGMSRQSEQLNAAIDDLLEAHQHDRAVLHGKLVTLAQCVGLLPPPARPQLQTAAIDAAIDGTQVMVGGPESNDFDLPRYLQRQTNGVHADGASVAHQQPRH